jgi:hypothetical protein
MSAEGSIPGAVRAFAAGVLALSSSLPALARAATGLVSHLRGDIPVPARVDCHKSGELPSKVLNFLAK